MPSSRPTALAAALGIAAGVLSVGTAGRAHAQTGSPPEPPPASRRAVVEHPPSPEALRGPATGLTPLVADFDGDRRSDVLWYGPGALPDHLWLGRPGRELQGVALSVVGTYEPVVGDFDGDRRADVLWYGAGAAPDRLWLGRPGGRFVPRAVSRGGDSQPVPGDFNGDGRTDILWYGVGPRGDVLWLAATEGYFHQVPIKVGGVYRPIVGDFNGDGPSDLFWYGPGTYHDVMWYGARSGAFRGVASTVEGRYEPVVGDFDGDSRRDILWYGPGASRDVLWYGQAGRGFAGRAVSIPVVGTPVAGDFDGTGRTDVLVHGAGTATDMALYGRSSRGFDVAWPSAGSTAQPVAGDFAGDRHSDIFWYAPGDARDVIWSGAGRGFSGRATTIDIGFTRTLPLRPEAINGQYTPYGFVAHAMGMIDGRTYTNTLEAFEHNYARGFRVFEADHVVLADGTVLVAHEGLEHLYGLNKKFSEATWSDLEGKKFAGRYTFLRAHDLVELMRRYPDAYFILDLKAREVEAFATYVRLVGGKPAMVDRLIPHVVDAAMLAGMRRYYPMQNYVVALYRSQAFGRLDDAEVLAWVRNARVPAAMMWHGQRDYSLSLAANHGQQRRYTSALVAGLRAAGAVAYVHTVDDPHQATWFWDRRIGLYTDELFPPFTPPPAGGAESQRSGAPEEYVGDEG